MTKELKERRYRSLHKILYIYEDISKGNCTIEELDTYLSNISIMFAGMNDLNPEIRYKTVSSLRGLRELLPELTHKDIRSCVLGLMEEFERGVVADA